MEGIVLVIAVVVALGVAWRLAVGRSDFRQKSPQSTDVPGETSPPDDWPRDGGNNPSGP